MREVFRIFANRTAEWVGTPWAFALALAARIRHEHARLLWLPLAVFPALVLFVVLGEAFWWE